MENWARYPGGSLWWDEKSRSKLGQNQLVPFKISERLECPSHHVQKCLGGMEIRIQERSAYRQEAVQGSPRARRAQEGAPWVMWCPPQSLCLRCSSSSCLYPRTDYQLVCHRYSRNRLLTGPPAERQIATTGQDWLFSSNDFLKGNVKFKRQFANTPQSLG